MPALQRVVHPSAYGQLKGIDDAVRVYEVRWRD